MTAPLAIALGYATVAMAALTVLALALALALAHQIVAIRTRRPDPTNTAQLAAMSAATLALIVLSLWSL